MIYSRRENVRAFCLFALFCLAVVGSYVPIFGLHALRAAILLTVLGAAPVFRSKSWLVSLDLRVLRAYMALALCWIIFGLIGIYRSYDVEITAREVLDVFFCISMGFAVAALVGTSLRVREVLPWSWVGAYLITAGVAFWEVATGQHLISYYVSKSELYVLERLWVKSTFSNPNDYAAFLLMCFPPIVYCASRLGSRIRKGYYVLVGVPFVVVMFLTGSRGGLLGLALEAAFLAYAAYGLRGLFILTAGSSGAIFFVFTYAAIDIDLSNGLLAKLINMQSSLEEGGSFAERIGLSLNGVYMLFDSYGVGVGPGQFESRVLMRDMPYLVSVPNPHNFVVEVASQYGVVVITALCGLLFLTARFHLRQLRFLPYNTLDRSFSVMMLASMVGYAIASLESSSYIPQPTNWLFLATLLASTLHRNRLSGVS